MVNSYIKDTSLHFLEAFVELSNVPFYQASKLLHALTLAESEEPVHDFKCDKERC